MKRLCVFLGLAMSLHSVAGSKFKLEDFAISLEQVTSGASHIWVNSGYTTVNPEYLTVLGVNEFYSPPLAAKNFRMRITIEADAIKIADTGSYGKGDVGLLYAGGTWYPHKIERRGTYHHLKNGKLVSLGVMSELIPMFGQAGVIEKVSITNRANHPVRVKLIPELEPGAPSFIAPESWGFGTPRANASAAQQVLPNIWANESATIALFRENHETVILPGETNVSWFSAVMKKKGEPIPARFNAAEMAEISTRAWERRLAVYTKNIPLLESNIEGLENYYRRSVISGLVCIWENPSYLFNPFVSTCGMDGGGMCAYLWDIAGYVPQMVTLMLDSAVMNVAKMMGNIDLEQFYAYTLNGKGTGVKYSYSPWAYTSFVSTIFKFLGPENELFSSVQKLVLNNEKQQKENQLIDYGVQNNLLEMRGAGWEHDVVSPNAERSWCLKQLAAMGKEVGFPDSECKSWNAKAEVIKQAILKELWDSKTGWFASVYPDGFKDVVYSIQAYDALRAGICTAEMEEKLTAHLRDGAFLGDYGITSISKEDRIHYEVLDTDWSGGGAYTGDGPQLALIMYEKNKPDLGWDILKRHFWMGKHLIYYPQEHFADKPVSPQHKRANVISGLGGAEAVLFGVIGFRPQYNGQLLIHPQPAKDGEIVVKGFGFRGSTFDVELSAEKMKVIRDGSVIYNGRPEIIQLSNLAVDAAKKSQN
ncbi:MAG: hypothetical protein PHI28_12135 [Mangrovibacterium sp.]|nr:hypothetical protein [Mangrovibacterium sp.]